MRGLQDCVWYKNQSNFAGLKTNSTICLPFPQNKHQDRARFPDLLLKEGCILEAVLFPFKLLL